MLTRVEIEILYGTDVVVTEKQGFQLIHVDQPTPEEIANRQAEFDPKTFFVDACPFCRTVKDGGVVVFGTEAAV